MRSVLLAAALVLTAGAALAEPAAPSEASAARPAKRLSIDSSLFELVADPRTAQVLIRRMPGFVERFRGDDQLQAMFGAITIRELSFDHEHARGFTPEVLAKLDAELIAAQAAPLPPPPPAR